MEEGQPEIVITQADIEKAVKPLTPKERHLNDLSAQVKDQARKNLEKAANTTEFLKWHRACLWSDPKYISWMVDVDPKTTAEDILADMEIFDAGREAKIADELREKIDQAADVAGQIKLTLKRVRDRSGDNWTYRVLAVFPEGTPVSDPVLGQNADPSMRHTIYFQPETACVTHACDDLYKNARDGGGIVYLPNLSVIQASERLHISPGGVAEYVISKTSEGTIKQNSQDQLLTGLLGGYSNESIRIRISDFHEAE